MSRTIKDMPWRVRACDYMGAKCPNDYRSTCWWVDSEWEDAVGFIPNDSVYAAIPFSNPVEGKMAKEQNRIYRAKSRQAMREGRYDDLVAPVRNARWLAW